MTIDEAFQLSQEAFERAQQALDAGDREAFNRHRAEHSAYGEMHALLGDERWKGKLS